MQEKKSAALKKRWAKIPKEKRSEIASSMAKARMEKMSKKAKTAHARMMLRSRYSKV